MSLVRGSLAGAVAGATLASACCIGPLLFALLGLGGAGAMVRLEPMRPVLAVLTLGLLAIGHVTSWKRRRSGADCGCDAPPAGMAAVVGLWAATVVALGLLAVPWILPFLPF